MDSSTCDAARQLLATAFVTTRVGEPDAGKLHVRFDEGERPRGRSLLDYRRPVVQARSATVGPIAA